MEKHRSSKIVAISALVVALVGLSVGFAAFSNSLKISSSATVTPDEDTFNVDFSSSNTALETNNIEAVVSDPKVVATAATIDNSGDPTISNLSATFTNPGQTATYTFYATNIGQYIAYLKDIKYGSVLQTSNTKVCTAKTNANGTTTTESLMNAACNDIIVKVKVGAENETDTDVNNIVNHSLGINAFEPVTVTIEYRTNGAVADGVFSVAFGDITLDYSSVD